MKKAEPSLGLTITDNGTGHAFVKRIRDTSIIAGFPEVCIGDLLTSINGRSMIGARHYEVAKLLKELPQFTEIAIELVEPRKSFGEGISGSSNWLFWVIGIRPCFEAAW